MAKRRFLSLAQTVCVVSALTAISCSDQKVAEDDPSAPQATLQMLAASGNNQTVRVRSDVPVTVRVIDGSSRPVPEATITWAVVNGSGTVVPQAVTTDAQGYVVATWTLGPEAGEQKIRASFGATSTVFSAAATPGEPATIAQFSGDGQVAASGARLGDAVAVVVRDEDGNAVSGIPVNWDVVLGGGVVNPASTTTDPEGVARTTWTLGQETGGAVVRASAANIGEATFSALAVDNEGRAVGNVDRMVLTPEGVALNAIGATASLKPTAYNERGQVVGNTTIMWNSLNPSVATVTEGRVTARGAGTTRIVATASCCNRSDTSNVVVTQQAVSVNMSPSSASVPVGGSTTLTATVNDANGYAIQGAQISWSSTNTAVAKVVNGVVTGVSAGTATIRAASGSLVASANVTIGTVAPSVASVTVTPMTPTLQVNGAIQLTATVNDASGTPLSVPVTWTSSNQTIAVVGTTGRVEAIAAGTTVISATAGGKTSGTEVVVTAATGTLSSVAITPATASVTVGATTQLVAVARDAKGNALSNYSFAWSTLNPGIATVNASGVVTGVAAGTATISASSGGKVATSTVTVSAPVATVARLALTQDTVKFTALGAQSALSATAYDATGKILPSAAISWKTSNATIATVDSVGRITAKGVGTALIIATAVCCNKADTAVAVITQQIAALTVSPRSTTIQKGSTSTLSAKAQDANANTISSASVTWSTSNSQIATVSNGVVTAVAAGNAVIRATSGTYRDSSVVTVQQTVTQPPPPPPPPTGGPYAAPDIASTSFDNGSSAPFTTSGGATNGNADIVMMNDPTGKFGGAVARMQYARLSTTLSADVNRALRYVSPSGIGLGQTIFMRGQVLVPTPAANMSLAMRKLFYVQRRPNDVSFAVIKADGNKLKAEITNNRVFSLGSFPFDAKVSIEAQITTNSSASASDGIFRVWVDGVLVLDRNDIQWLTSTTPFTVFMFGDQTQHQLGDKTILFDEFRYWDNMALSSKRIGP